MKRTLLVATLALASSVVAFGQGQIVFTTFGSGVNAPATNALTMQVAAGNAYYCQLFYGPLSFTEEQLVPLTNAPATLNVIGYVTTASGGGTRYTDPAVLDGNADGKFQVRAWTAALGANYTDALTSWRAGSNPSAVLGKSQIVNRTPSKAPAAPTPLVGLTGAIMLQPIPEPSVMVLAGLGLLGLLIRRRK